MAAPVTQEGKIWRLALPQSPRRDLQADLVVLRHPAELPILESVIKYAMHPAHMSCWELIACIAQYPQSPHCFEEGPRRVHQTIGRQPTLPSYRQTRYVSCPNNPLLPYTVRLPPFPFFLILSQVQENSPCRFVRILFHLVTRLNEVRDDHTAYSNRLDTTLADVFNLLSLFFLTIGRTRECPATYSQIASMRVSTAQVPSLNFQKFSVPSRRQRS